MSKKDENNSQIIIKNNSNQNLKQYIHHKNKSSNFLTDSPSTLITMQLYSINSNKNSKNKEQKSSSINNKESPKNYTNNVNNSLQNLNNIRIKLSKLGSQFSANTPKQLASIYNQLCGIKMDPSNIVVKKNLKLEINDSQKMKNSHNYKSERNNNNNEFVKYVNNDKSNFKGNFLNMTQNYSKFISSYNKSFIITDKDGFFNVSNISNNKSCNNTNIKKNNRIIFNTGNNKNKKFGITVLNKSTNNLYRSCYSKNIKDNIDLITSKSQKELFINNNIINKNYSKGKQKFSDDISDTNNKKIYFMKPIHKRKKSINKNKSIENSNNNTNHSSICSKNKNILDDNTMMDFFKNNIENPEELHFFYVQILQKTSEISKKFEID